MSYSESDKKENKKNILWINYVKAISIISVYFVHSGLYYGLYTDRLNCFIHPFYVNSFFFISGYLFFRKQLSEKILNENIKTYIFNGAGHKLINNIIYRLIIPTILFSMIEFLPSHMLRGYEFGIGNFLYKTIGGCTYWFTSALIITEILCLLLLLTREKNIWFYFICSCIIFAIGKCMVLNGFSLFHSYPDLPWQYKNGMYAIIFFTLGGLYWNYEIIINGIMSKYILLFMILVYLLVLILVPNSFHVLVSTLDVNIPGICISLLSIIILIEVCKLLPNCKLLNYIGKNTISFYFMSGALPIVISLIIHKILSATSFLGLFIVFGGSISIGLIAVYVMNKFTPWLFDLRLLRNTIIRPLSEKHN